MQLGCTERLLGVASDAPFDGIIDKDCLMKIPVITFCSQYVCSCVTRASFLREIINCVLQTCWLKQGVWYLDIYLHDIVLQNNSWSCTFRPSTVYSIVTYYVPLLFLIRQIKILVFNITLSDSDMLGVVNPYFVREEVFWQAGKIFLDINFKRLSLNIFHEISESI